MSTAAEAKEAGGKAWSDGNFLEACEHFTNAISLASGDSEMLKVLYSNRSASYLKIGRSSEALADANKCIELDAQWSKGLVRKGDALMMLSRNTEALEIFESLLRTTPGDTSAKTKLTQIRAAIHAQANPFTTPAPMHKLAGKPLSFIDRYTTIQSYIRMAICVCGIGYVIPWQVISRPCHTFFLIFAVVNYTMTLYRSYGMPRLTQEYAQLVLPDGITQLMFLAVMQFAFHAYYLAMMPILLGEVAHIIPWYLVKMQKDSPDIVEKANAAVNQYIPPALGISVDQWVGMPAKAKWEIFNTIVRLIDNDICLCS